MAIVARPDPASKTCEGPDAEVPWDFFLVKEGADSQVTRILAPMAPILPPLRGSRIHDPSVNLFPRNTEVMHKTIAFESQNPHQELFCGRGKEALK